MHPSIFSHLSKSLGSHATLSQLGNVVFLSWVCAALLLVGHAPKTPDLGSSRTHVGQIPEPPQLPPFTVEEQQLHFLLLPSVVSSLQLMEVQSEVVAP